ncbi:hypothetical protein EVAR_88784_1 [Eumeta japonica]|uniref:Uncharacterized protein n=1 Tax=Eumeta variegata TaxID=151549 RepID=A0A4C1XTK5_EUMVA|nr:hypothetical protein EVAR_88784_1 [Eumeta japonica]
MRGDISCGRGHSGRRAPGRGRHTLRWRTRHPRRARGRVRNLVTSGEHYCPARSDTDKGFLRFNRIEKQKHDEFCSGAGATSEPSPAQQEVEATQRRNVVNAHFSQLGFTKHASQSFTRITVSKNARTKRAGKAPLQTLVLFYNYHVVTVARRCRLPRTSHRGLGAVSNDVTRDITFIRSNFKFLTLKTIGEEKVASKPAHARTSGPPPCGIGQEQQQQLRQLGAVIALPDFPRERSASPGASASAPAEGGRAARAPALDAYCTCNGTYVRKNLIKRHRRRELGLSTRQVHGHTGGRPRSGAAAAPVRLRRRSGAVRLSTGMLIPAGPRLTEQRRARLVW